MTEQTLKQRQDNGMTRTNLFEWSQSKDSTASISATDKLVYQKPIFDIDIIQKSWAYGDQVQFISRTTTQPMKGPRTDSHNGLNYRMEVGYIPLDTFSYTLATVNHNWHEFEKQLFRKAIP